MDELDGLDGRGRPTVTEAMGEAEDQPGVQMPAELEMGRIGGREAL